MKICNNDPLVNYIREKYNACPVEKPDTAFKVGQLLTRTKESVFTLRGKEQVALYADDHFSEVLIKQPLSKEERVEVVAEEVHVFQKNIKSSIIRDIPKKSSSFDAKFGLNILEKFLPKLPLNFKFEFNNEKAQIFFEEVHREWVSSSKLQEALNSRFVDVENHPNLNENDALEKKQVELFVIDSVFRSKVDKIRFSQAKGSSSSMKILNMLDLDASFKVSDTTEALDIKVLEKKEADKLEVFAFTCIRISIKKENNRYNVLARANVKDTSLSFGQNKSGIKHESFGIGNNQLLSLVHLPRE